MDFHAVANLRSWPGFRPSRLPAMGTVSATNLGPHGPTVEHADAVSQGDGQRTRFRALAKALRRALFDRFDRP